MQYKKVKLKPYQNLADLAYIFYKDSAKWKLIADANPEYSIFSKNYSKEVKINVPLENVT